MAEAADQTRQEFWRPPMPASRLSPAGGEATNEAQPAAAEPSSSSAPSTVMPAAPAVPIWALVRARWKSLAWLSSSRSVTARAHHACPHRFSRWRALRGGSSGGQRVLQRPDRTRLAGHPIVADRVAARGGRSLCRRVPAEEIVLTSSPWPLAFGFPSQVPDSQDQASQDQDSQPPVEPAECMSEH